MFFEEKLKEINTILEQIDKEENILIWGIGQHTNELLKYTDLLLYKNLIFTSQDNTGDRYFGRPVISKLDLDFNKIDCIIISSCKYQNEIEEDIRNIGFNKKVIKFYQKVTEGEFFCLPHYDDKNGFYVQGNYSTWEEADNSGGGYDKPGILKKVYEATIEVINGSAAYERDSVLFYEPKYTFHLLTLIGVLYSQKATIHIIDVGGALGSLYWQNKHILDQYEGKKFYWKVIEQPNYVQCGRKNIQNENISFEEEIDEVDNADIVIFSGVLQYIDNYSEMIKKAVNLKPRYILVDRIWTAEKGRIAVEYVNENICEGSYPARVFEESEILHQMKGYDLKVKFPSCVDHYFYVEGQRVDVQCMIFELK